jgi:putative ABC transport system permease protein
MPWVLRMAWRDSRGRRRRLVLYTGAIAMGIAALVGLRGLGRSMTASIDQQSATLLGADMKIESDRPFAANVESVIDSLGGRQARQVQLNSMVYLPKSGGTRLAQIRFLAGGYPFYGALRTDPPDAAQTFRSQRAALVDQGLMLQYEAQVGDSIRVGRASFRIAGTLLSLPGETALRADIQPPVLVPLQFLQETDLVKRGSRVEHKVYLRFDDGRDPEALEKELERRFENEEDDIDVDTIADRRRRLDRTLGNLSRFLGLGGFVALLLGAVGVASAIHTHVQQKLETVAVLRTLGASGRQGLLIYLIQAGAMGFIGALLGGLLGSALLFPMPALVADFLPDITIAVDLSPVPLLEGLVVGTGIALLFAALPLLAVRRASPLLALRASFEPETVAGDRLWRVGLILLALCGILVLANILAGRPDHALFFTGGSLAALILLALFSQVLRYLTRRFFPTTWSYIWRQGLANLYRPQNQTLLLLVSLGLGTFLVAALYTAQSSLLAHINSVSGGDQPNVVLFDIQTDQRDQVTDLVRSLEMPILQEVPIVSMYIAQINGQPIEQRTQGRRRGNWAFRREYRSTYRDHLTATEELVAGHWHGQTNGDTVYVSLEEDIVGNLGVGLGDSLVFNVQGVHMSVVVGSIRRVDWQRIMPNFFMVFPTGLLEEAPQFHVLVTRADDAAKRAQLQRQAVRQFPNLSIIDLDLILGTIDAVLAKVSAVVRLMAFFSIATGLVVLIAVVSGSNLQRQRESILLRTLGASRAQTTRILMLEYLFLGTLAALSGLLLALAGGWGLSRFVFDVSYAPDLLPLLIALVAVPLVTVLVGFAGSRGIHRAPPLEVLRTTD